MATQKRMPHEREEERQPPPDEAPQEEKRAAEAGEDELDRLVEDFLEEDVASEAEQRVRARRESRGQ